MYGKGSLEGFLLTILVDQRKNNRVAMVIVFDNYTRKNHKISIALQPRSSDGDRDAALSRRPRIISAPRAGIRIGIVGRRGNIFVLGRGFGACGIVGSSRVVEKRFAGRVLIRGGGGVGDIVGGNIRGVLDIGRCVLDVGRCSGLL